MTRLGRSASGVAAPQEPPSRLIVVRATVNLPGLPRDRIATVDATDPEIRRYLRATLLVPLPAADQPGLNSGEQP